MYEDHDNYNCCITLDDGQHHYVYANWLRNTKQHAWQGWHCEAGVTRIMIDKNLDVWSGECKNDSMGRLDQTWQLIENHSVCQRHTCTACTDDLAVAKWQP